MKRFYNPKFSSLGIRALLITSLSCPAPWPRRYAVFLQAVAQGVVAEGLHRLMCQWDACHNHQEVCYSLHFYGQNNLLTSFVSPAFVLLSHPILLQQTTNFQTANTLQSTYTTLYTYSSYIYLFFLSFPPVRGVISDSFSRMLPGPSEVHTQTIVSTQPSLL